MVQNQFVLLGISRTVEAPPEFHQPFLITDIGQIEPGAFVVGREGFEPWPFGVLAK